MNAVAQMAGYGELAPFVGCELARSSDKQL